MTSGFVIVNGTCKMKFGKFTDENPVIHPSCVAWNRSTMGIMPAPDIKPFFTGNEMLLKRGIGVPKYPFPLDYSDFKSGMLKRLWKAGLDECDEMEFPPNLVVSEIRNMKESYLEILFSDYHKKRQNVLLGHSSLMGMIGSGRTSGAILDLGFQKTSCVCLKDGYFIPRSYRKMNIGGENVTYSYIDLIISNCKDFFRSYDLSSKTFGLTSFEVSMFEEFFQKHSFAQLPNQDTTEEKILDFLLPDNTTINIPLNSTFGEPCEILFNPSKYFSHYPSQKKDISSLPNILHSSIHKNSFQDYSKLMEENIVVMGGISMIRNMPEKIHQEYCNRFGKSYEDINLIYDEKRYKLDFYGGKIMMSTYPKN